MNNGRKIIYDAEIAYLFDNLKCACITLLISRCFTKNFAGEKQDYGLKSSIIVKNYETNLLFFAAEVEEILSKSHIVCLKRESVSEARMDVFQAMTWWRRTITCCNTLGRAQKKKEMFLWLRRKQKQEKFIQLSGHDLYKISRFLPLSAALFFLIISKGNFYCSFCKWKTRFLDISTATFSFFSMLAFSRFMKQKTIENNKFERGRKNCGC